MSQKLLSPKEISDAIKSRHGIVVSARFIRAMLRAGVRRVGYYATVDDVMAWWYDNPDFSARPLASPNVTDEANAA